uniref:Uncharacterized protein n=1 Tax=candidate division WOR-3 bacterium TaxID=2052148 RepID=A0A7V3RHB2_UNCW3
MSRFKVIETNFLATFIIPLDKYKILSIMYILIHMVDNLREIENEAPHPHPPPLKGEERMG